MSDQEQIEKITRLLEELRDNQRTQLERYTEVLAIQKKQLELFQQQHDKTMALQTRAESLQERSAQMVNVARRMFPFMIGILIILIAYVTWLLVRTTAR